MVTLLAADSVEEFVDGDGLLAATCDWPVAVEVVGEVLLVVAGELAAVVGVVIEAVVVVTVVVVAVISSMESLGRSLELNLLRMKFKPSRRLEKELMSSSHR